MKHQLWLDAAIALCSLEGDLKTRELKTKQKEKDEDMEDTLMRPI